MSTIGGGDLRVALVTEMRNVPVIEPGDGFSFQLTGQKIHDPTASPVLFFDVLDAQRQRIGIASIVAGPDAPALALTGHVCAMLSRETATPELLSRVGDSLIRAAFGMGLTVVRIAVPATDALSVDACRLLQPAAESLVTTENGAQHAIFLYYPVDYKQNGTAA
jgi:hypothetical protein